MHYNYKFAKKKKDCIALKKKKESIGLKPSQLRENYQNGERDRHGR